MTSEVSGQQQPCEKESAAAESQAPTWTQNMRSAASSTIYRLFMARLTHTAAETAKCTWGDCCWCYSNTLIIFSIFFPLRGPASVPLSHLYQLVPQTSEQPVAIASPETGSLCRRRYWLRPCLKVTPQVCAFAEQRAFKLCQKWHLFYQDLQYTPMHTYCFKFCFLTSEIVWIGRAFFEAPGDGGHECHTMPPVFLLCL